MGKATEKKEDLVRMETKGRTAVITIQNPPVNVLTTGVLDGLSDALDEVGGREDIAVVVISGGQGKAFMAGADIKGFPDMCGVPGAAYGYAHTVYEVWDRIEAFPKPVIADINGLALGAGLELALVCDIRVADERARFGFPEIALGLFPGGGGTQRMAYAANQALTKEMVLTGKPIDSARALASGLLNYVTPAGGSLDKALELAEQISAYSTKVLALAKQAVGAAYERAEREGLGVEAALWQKSFMTEDIKEGVSAFLEKRKPVFQDR